MTHVLVAIAGIYLLGILVVLSARTFLPDAQACPEPIWRRLGMIWPFWALSLVIGCTLLTIVLLMTRLRLLSPDGMRRMEAIGMRAVEAWNKRGSYMLPAFEDRWLADRCCTALQSSMNVRGTVRAGKSKTSKGDDIWVIEWPDHDKDDRGVEKWALGYRWGALEMRDSYVALLEAMVARSKSEEGARLLGLASRMIQNYDHAPSDADVSAIEELLGVDGRKESVSDDERTTVTP